jgi:hypothetical protein
VECCLLICTFAIPKGSATSLNMLRRWVTALFLHFFALKTLGLPLVPLMSSIKQLYPLPKVQGKQHVVEFIPFCEQQMECPSINTYYNCWYQGFWVGTEFFVFVSLLYGVVVKVHFFGADTRPTEQSSRIFWSVTFQIMLLTLNGTLLMFFFHQYGR